MGMVITIGGMPGSGKSTLGRMLATRLGVPFFSMGDIRRDFAKRNGMTLAELNELAVKDPSSDNLVDKFQSELPKEHNSFIIDSRLGWHFLPESVKIYLKVDLRQAAERILLQKRKEESWKTVEEGVKSMEERQANDSKRYKKLYGVDHRDTSNYDFVIDTTMMNPMEQLTAVVSFLQEKGYDIAR